MVRDINKKTGRNEKCICGSGKKYKKCCLKTKVTIDSIKRNTTKLNSIMVEDINRDKSVEWVRRMAKMPDELKRDVEDVLENKDLRVRGCWYNSSHIALDCDDVVKVDGWYGMKCLDDKDIVEIKKGAINKKYTMKKVGDDFYSDRNDVVFDTKNGISYSRHSWNKYGDTHFDVTVELTDPKELGATDDDWVYYVEDSVDTSTTFSNENYELSASIMEDRTNTNSMRLLNDVEGEWKTKLFNIPSSNSSIFNRLFAI
jgi:hypothetical protein